MQLEILNNNKLSRGGKMKNVLIYFVFCCILIPVQTFSQVWQQTAGTPQGSGVTDMLIKQSNGFLYVTTGSINFPSEPGGVRVSTDGGNTWQNQTFSFIARTIIEAPDGNLYASIWPDPNLFAAEGLYRTTNNGAVWSPLGFVQAGDNIFSIAVSPTTPVITIFAGTRNGVIRSTDNGGSFQNTSSGIPANSWVRDLAVDTSTGIIAAATTNGLFISTNNGDLWQQASGIAASDTIVSLTFDYPLSTASAPGTNINAGTQKDELFSSETTLYAGTQNGKAFKSILSSQYLLATLLAIFDEGELGGWMILYLNQLKYYAFKIFPGGVYTSTNPEQGFTKENDGLPQNPKTSALAGKVIPGGNQVELCTGLFENTIGGAKIYKRTFTVTDVEEISSVVPGDFSLYQNYPNPFNPSTTIQFALPKESFTKLEIFNALGEKVSTLVSETISAGTYKYEWNAKDLSSGIYFYRLSTENYVQTKKLLLIK